MRAQAEAHVLRQSEKHVSPTWLMGCAGLLLAQRAAHMCTQPSEHSRELGAVVAAQSGPPKPSAQTHVPSRQRPRPAQSSRHVRDSQRAPAYPGSQAHHLPLSHRPCPEHPYVSFTAGSPQPSSVPTYEPHVPPQSSPKKPGEHEHTPARQIPCPSLAWQPLGHALFEQSCPSQPKLHTQPLRRSHTPLFEQPLSHEACLHSAPLHPAMHMHLPSRHSPRGGLQPGLHAGGVDEEKVSVQSGPPRPGGHRQVKLRPGRHCPAPPQSLGHCRLAQSSPAHPSSHEHDANSPSGVLTQRPCCEQPFGHASSWQPAPV